MASMPSTDSCHRAEAAVAVIGRAVDVGSKRRPDSGRARAPDWCLKLTNGSVVYVEVTRNTDGGTSMPGAPLALHEREEIGRALMADPMASWAAVARCGNGSPPTCIQQPRVERTFGPVESVPKMWRPPSSKCGAPQPARSIGRSGVVAKTPLRDHVQQPTAVA